MDAAADTHRTAAGWQWLFASDVHETLPMDGIDFPARVKLMDKAAVQRSGSRSATFPVADGETPPLARTQPMSAADHALAVLLLFLVPGSALWAPVVSLALGAAWVVGVVRWTWLVAYHGALAAVWLVPGSYWAAALRSRASWVLLRYFSFKVVWANSLDPARQYVLAASPHGAFPFGNVLCMLSSPTCAGFAFKGLAATAALSLPFYKQLFGWIGAVDASRAVAYRVMGAGDSVGLAPGGIAEMYLPQRGRDVRVLLKCRKGFIKLAMVHGATLCPGFVFGNSDAMSIITDKWGVCHRVSRAIKASLVLIYGRWGLPVPYRVPVAACMAEPIVCTRDPNPSQEAVSAVHKEFCDRVVQVFNTHKTAYGWGDRTLTVC